VVTRHLKKAIIVWRAVFRRVSRHGVIQWDKILMKNRELSIAIFWFARKVVFCT